MQNLIDSERLLMDTLVNQPTERDLQFLNLSGRKAFWSQGFKGRGQVVAVVDTGISPHQEFGDRLLEGRNFTKDYNGDPNKTTDHHGHGTHCAGTIVGATVGKAPLAEVVPVKVLDAVGNGTPEQVIEGLKYCLLWKHPITGRRLTLVSMSLSFPSLTTTQLNSLRMAVSNLVNAGISVVCSAGNTSKEEMRYPAGLDEVICVGAIDIEKKQAYFTTKGDHVDVCSIGVDVLSACHTGGYVKMSGTSMSTPYVAGDMVLLSDKYERIYKKAIPEQLRYELTKFNSKDLGIEGVDKIFGAGFVTLQPTEAEILLQVNNHTIYINGEATVMEAPAQIINGRFMVPIRFVTENSGAFVTWYSDSDGSTTGAKVVY